MDKFFNAFGFGLAVLLAWSIAVQSPASRTQSKSVPETARVVTDPIAAQGNAAVRAIQEDARNAARMARPTALEVAER